MEHIAPSARLVTTIDLLAQFELLLGKAQKGFGVEPLRGLGRSAIDHPADTVMIGVPVDPQLDLVITRGLRFGRCDVLLSIGMSVDACIIFHIT